jgi:hypothetical protein
MLKLFSRSGSIFTKITTHSPELSFQQKKREKDNSMRIMETQIELEYVVHVGIFARLIERLEVYASEKAANERRCTRWI